MNPHILLVYEYSVYWRPTSLVTRPSLVIGVLVMNPGIITKHLLARELKSMHLI